MIPWQDLVYYYWLVQDNSMELIIKKEAKLYNNRHEHAKRQKCVCQEIS